MNQIGTRGFFQYWRVILLFFVYTQLSAFTLTVTKTDELCTSNGSLIIAVANTTAGATMVYAIYRLPNVTVPIAIQTTTSLGGLVSGTYRVVATESLGSNSSIQQQEVTIVNQTVLLNYQLSVENIRCGNDGKVTVNIVSGSPNFHYEIFQGPMIFPLQTSNIFSGLVAGQYSIRVFDNCGEGVVQFFTIASTTTNLNMYNYDFEVLTCDTVKVTDAISSISSTVGTTIYPLTVQYTVIPPSGAPVVYPAQTISTGFPSGTLVSQTIPYYYNQTNTYAIQVTDGCNHVYQHTFNLDFHLELTLSQSNGICASDNIFIHATNFVSSYTVSFLEYPEGFSSLSGNPNDPGPFTDDQIYNTYGIYGHYTVQITDACGRTVVQSIDVYPQSVSQSPEIYTSQGCEEGYGGIEIYATTPLVYVALIYDSNNYISTPDVVTNYVGANGVFTMGSLPAGSYAFAVTDLCGYNFVLEAEIDGYHELVTNVNIIEHCGSFDIDLNNTSNALNSTPTFWLQKFNPVTQLWGHPATGVPFINNGNVPGSSNSISLINEAINYNFAFTGTFRVIKSFPTFGTGQMESCLKVLKEFTFDGLPKINKVYSMSCNNGTYDVIVDAVGIPPLLYRIVEKDGQPFLVENGNSYFFLGIPAAHYKFQVEDPCGNILNSEFDVPSPFDFGITATDLCDGQSGILVVPNFSLLQYTWWKDNNISSVLSTSNVLSIPAFNTINDAGLYHVRVQYTGNPNSCIDFVLTQNVTGNLSPNAGSDNSVSYCGNPDPIDLNTILIGPYEPAGSWQELSNSGALSGNVWNTTNVSNAVYHFSYTVEGTCNTSDVAYVNIEIKETPKNLTAAVDPLICESQNIALTASTIPNATYSWTGPNAFSSTEQNPIITNASSVNSGVYAVSAAIADCISPSIQMNVNVVPVPDFKLEGKCDNNRFEITAIPTNTTLDLDTVTYSWVGPSNYANTMNPIDITNLAAGIYSLIVTDANGCDSMQSISVPTTFCEIPNVITPNNDGTNDELDLSGLGVDRIEIYNRWGRKVYEKNMYLKEWHGQNMQGNQLPDSTYYYYIKLQNNESKVGWVFVNGS